MKPTITPTKHKFGAKEEEGDLKHTQTSNEKTNIAHTHTHTHMHV